MDYQTNPVKAIRAYCLNCCLENANEVAKCPAERCELYPFRFGKNPYREKRELTPGQIEAARERMRHANAVKNGLKHHQNNDVKMPNEAREYKNTSEEAN